MSWRVHPWPWFRIVKLVTAPNTVSQMLKGRTVIAFVIFQFTKHHGLTNTKNGKSRIVEEFTFRGNSFQRFVEIFFFLFCFDFLL